MRILLAATAASIIVLMSAACGGDSKASPTPSATAVAPATAGATIARATVAATPGAAATAPPAGATVEVTGIVGGLDLTGKVIQIRRLQGAAVTQVSVDARTSIKKAAGGTVAFKDIRTSDRIIARGTLNDRRDILLASEITLQDVVPGAEPGG